MKSRILVLPGDGVGPEVAAAAQRVLTAVAERYGHEFEFPSAKIGGVAIDECGDPMPAETVRACEGADAILLGAVGGPRWSDPDAPARPEQGLLSLRHNLGIFANLRPIRPHPRLAHISPIKTRLLAGVDIMVVRELTGGIYFGAKERDRERARDECIYTVTEIERIVRVAGKIAQSRRGKLTSIDKANVLETSRLWRSTTARVVREEFPELAIEHLLVDAAAMHLLSRPADFDVIVTENMFGDIISDEAAMLAGSLGLLPSASLSGSGPGVFEPIHGSAPDIAGQGVANPIGAIGSAAMLLRHALGLNEEANAVEAAINATFEAGVVTRDLSLHNMGANTRTVTAAVIESLTEATIADLSPA